MGTSGAAPSKTAAAHESQGGGGQRRRGGGVERGGGSGFRLLKAARAGCSFLAASEKEMINGMQPSKFDQGLLVSFFGLETFATARVL